MSHNLPDYNMDEPEPNELSEFVIELLQDEFDANYLDENDMNSDLMLKFVKGEITEDELKELRSKLEIDYEKAFAVYVDANYDTKVDDMNDPY
jgi:hypothetical protein